MSYATELFGDILHPRLDRGEIFIDPARFVADPEKAQRFPDLAYVTVRLVFLACEYFNADTGLALVRPEHQAFYRRVFLNETIAEPRAFPNVLKKVALMASDFRIVRERVLTRFPIMRSSAFERRMLFERGSDQMPVIDLPEFTFERATIVPRVLTSGPAAASDRKLLFAAEFCPSVPAEGTRNPWKTADFDRISRLPSPSRHIYNPLTIAVAFRRLVAFDRVWQRPIKVDGTFA